MSHCRTEPSHNDSFLQHDDPLCLFGGLHNQILIQGLDRRNVDDFRLNPFRQQFFRRLIGDVQQASRGDQGHVLALSYFDTLSDLEAIGIRIKHDWNRVAPQTDIDRAIVIDHCLDCGPHFHCITGIQNNHVRYGCHYGQILHCLVGRAVLAY